MKQKRLYEALRRIFREFAALKKMYFYVLQIFSRRLHDTLHFAFNFFSFEFTLNVKDQMKNDFWLGWNAL